MDRRRSSHIVPEIYEATINPDHWDYVVTMIAKLTQSKSAFLYYKNKGMGFANTIAQYGLSESGHMNSNDKFDLLDHIFINENSAGSEDVNCTQFHFGSGDTTRQKDLELHQKWMKPNGISHVGGAQFANTESHKAGIAILRDE
ncbi:MAG: hypothetical protein ACR2QW_12100, partial [bacterium]